MRGVGLLVVASAVWALAAAGTAAAQVVAGDSAVGSGQAGDWIFDFNATSGPAGENPSGTGRFTFHTIEVAGTVSCLGVTGTRAVIGLSVTSSSAGPFPGAWISVTDGGGAAGEDTFDARPEWSGVPTDCSVPPLPLAEAAVDRGDIVIHDAPPRPTSIDQCTKGGWRSFQGFKNQGQCVSFVTSERPRSG
jgi:hypothetical protein